MTAGNFTVSKPLLVSDGSAQVWGHYRDGHNKKSQTAISLPAAANEILL